MVTAVVLYGGRVMELPFIVNYSGVPTPALRSRWGLKTWWEREPWEERIILPPFTTSETRVVGSKDGGTPYNGDLPGLPCHPSDRNVGTRPPV